MTVFLRRVPLLLGATLLIATGPVRAESPPVLWGYGVQTCNGLTQAAAGTAQGSDAEILEYGRFREWLAGFVSGLNLATGRDVLNGMAISAAMRQIEADCEDDPQRDVFSATMGLVRESMQFDQLVR